MDLKSSVPDIEKQPPNHNQSPSMFHSRCCIFFYVNITLQTYLISPKHHSSRNVVSWLWGIDLLWFYGSNAPGYVVLWHFWFVFLVLFWFLPCFLVHLVLQLTLLPALFLIICFYVRFSFVLHPWFSPVSHQPLTLHFRLSHPPCWSVSTDHPVFFPPVINLISTLVACSMFLFSVCGLSLAPPAGQNKGPLLKNISFVLFLVLLHHLIKECNGCL